jgi:hypothetical protein
MLRIMSVILLSMTAQVAAAEYIQAICTPEYSYTVDEGGIFEQIDVAEMPDRYINFDEELLALSMRDAFPLVLPRVARGESGKYDKLYQVFWPNGHSRLDAVKSANRADCGNGHMTHRTTLLISDYINVVHSKCKCPER